MDDRDRETRPQAHDSAILSERITALIRRIPKGNVATYGQIAVAAGNPRAARLVVRVLRSRSEKYRLPWHRVVNSRGTISLPRDDGFEIQRALLLDEGVSVDPDGRIDLSIYGV